MDFRFVFGEKKSFFMEYYTLLHPKGENIRIIMIKINSTVSENE